MSENKENRVLISVITPTFNRVDFLQECIESVQSSVISPLNFQFEHIVSDDGSTDGTPEIMESLTKKYPNLKYLRNEENRGGSAVLNQAIEASSGEWIFVLDDDDVTFQRTLYNFAKTIEQYGQEHSWFAFDFIRSDHRLRYEIGNDYYGWEFGGDIEAWLSAYLNRKHFLQHNTIYTKNLWLAAGKYDENFRKGKDFELYMRFAIKQNVLPKYLPIFSHIHRFHDSNLSLVDNQHNLKNPETLKQVLEKHPELKTYPAK